MVQEWSFGRLVDSEAVLLAIGVRWTESAVY